MGFHQSSLLAPTAFGAFYSCSFTDGNIKAEGFHCLSLFLQIQPVRRSPPPRFQFTHELCKDPPLALGGWTVFLCLCSLPVSRMWTPIRTRIKCPHLVATALSSNSCSSVASKPRLVFSCDGVQEMSRSNFLSLFSQHRLGIKLRPQKEATTQQFFQRGMR